MRDRARLTGWTRLALGHGLAVVVVVCALALAISWGGGSATSSASRGVAEDVLPVPVGQVLLALAVITAAARATGLVFERWLAQPPVVGEIVAGILLGPSFLGAISPLAQAAVLPPTAAPFVEVIAQLGVVLFMFLVGLEVDLPALVRQGSAVLLVAETSVAVPFAMGVLLGLGAHAGWAPAGVPALPFALFFGVAMSVTAFPVLARILIDRGRQGSAVGRLALASASINDALAWVMLAIVDGVATAQTDGMARMVGAIVLYLGVMVLLVRPALFAYARRFDRSYSQPTRTSLAAVFSALLVSAVATDAIGIHALFGAFVLGAMMPHEGALADTIRARLEDLVVVLFLPAFFAFTGMRTHLGLVATKPDALMALLIVVVATVGKVGGTWIGARLAGLRGAPALATGVLMNTRGLMELIVLNVGLDLGILTPTIFSMMVVMALVTTLATSPWLSWIERWAPEVAGDRLPPGPPGAA